MASFFDDIGNMISMAITPALLLLGVMIQMRVLNNRLDRINDRSETLEQRLSIGSELRPALVGSCDLHASPGLRVPFRQ